MRRVKVSAANKVVQRIAVIGCAAILGVGAAACGSAGNTVTPKAPTPTTPAPTTARPTVTTPPTTAPKSGGAGF
jgi:hypothetical protein